MAGKRLAGGRGGVQVMATRDGSGCPLTIALDLRGGQAAAVWTALTVLDDDAQTVAADENAHRRRWQAWLYWSNLLQFLNDGEGDGVQLASSGLSAFDPVELAVTGGAGWLQSRRQAGEQEPRAVSSTDAIRADAGTTASAGTLKAPARTVRAPAEAMADQGGAVRDPAWNEVLAYLVDEPGLAELAEGLAAGGVPAPVAGFELGDDAWSAELAWPPQRIGVVLAPLLDAEGEPDPDDLRRDEAYARAGWLVRPATGWTVEELALALTGPAPGPRTAPDDPNDLKEQAR